ncbi:MAG: F0F1 ATP synthase subunit delta [Puniceicoccales bacterium]|nr:F0F1 ATP synthase subunit delta [Puniceicoccales bacterium]
MVPEKRLHSIARQLADCLLAGPNPREALRLALSEIATLDKALRLRLLCSLHRALLRAGDGLVPPSVEYAGKLADADRKSLERWLAEKLGRTVHLAQKKKSELIGGIRLSVGDRRWELSVRSALAQFLADG